MGTGKDVGVGEGKGVGVDVDVGKGMSVGTGVGVLFGLRSHAASRMKNSTMEAIWINFGFILTA